MGGPSSVHGSRSYTIRTNSELYNPPPPNPKCVGTVTAAVWEQKRVLGTSENRSGSKRLEKSLGLAIAEFWRVNSYFRTSGIVYG